MRHRKTDKDTTDFKIVNIKYIFGFEVYLVVTNQAFFKLALLSIAKIKINPYINYCSSNKCQFIFFFNSNMKLGLAELFQCIFQATSFHCLFFSIDDIPHHYYTISSSVIIIH